MRSEPTVVPLAAFSAMVLPESVTPVGASFTFVTVITKTLSVNRPLASVERTRTVQSLFVSKSKEAAVLSTLPSIAKNALSVSPAPTTSA
ncbi:MAG: hypothetical protein LW698_06525 [Planctomycetaceae bacterium]|nr:hypothetical protein [Planctomycetaceae bacterium]